MNAEFHGRIRQDGGINVDIGRIDRPTKLNVLEFDRSTGANKSVESGERTGGPKSKNEGALAVVN